MAKAVIEPGEPGNIIQIISTIAKDAGVLGKTQSGGVPFAFRGIDATINHLAEHLDNHGVLITNRVIDKVTRFRAFVNNDNVPNGKGITETDITVEYTFWAPDGSYLTTQAAGLAQDHADRSAAQAQSVALRVALLQLFHLPTTDKEPEERGEETIRATSAHAQAQASQPARAKEPSYRDMIVALINDDTKPNITADEANATLVSVVGHADFSKLSDADFKKAYEALTK